MSESVFWLIGVLLAAALVAFIVWMFTDTKDEDDEDDDNFWMWS